MSEQTATKPADPEVFQRAVDAAHGVLGRALGAYIPVSRETVAAALEAAVAVYDADHVAEVKRLVDSTLLQGMDVKDGGVAIRMVMADEIKLAFLNAIRTWLDANPGAENYVEQTITYPRDHPDGPGRYVLIACKPGGKTPHQLRTAAEDRLRRLADVRDELADHVEIMHDKQPWENRAMFNRLLAALNAAVEPSATKATGGPA